MMILLTSRVTACTASARDDRGLVALSTASTMTRSLHPLRESHMTVDSPVGLAPTTRAVVCCSNIDEEAPSRRTFNRMRGDFPKRNAGSDSFGGGDGFGETVRSLNLHLEGARLCVEQVKEGQRDRGTRQRNSCRYTLAMPSLP